jgi:hypothetical protein
MLSLWIACREIEGYGIATPVETVEAYRRSFLGIFSVRGVLF